MKNPPNPYLPFSSFTLRTPLLPFGFFRELTANEFVTDELLKVSLQNKMIKEAIFLASPSLYNEISKWIEHNLDPKKSKKLKYSILKYLTRMSTRCTPFGLFAGCALGKIVEGETNIENGQADKNFRHTRLDMNYLVALSQDLGEKTEFKEKLLFFPNSSIYESGQKLRYIEYYYIESRRHHRVVEVDNTEYLQTILNKASSGTLLNDLVPMLKDEDISNEQAEAFINELVHCQLLVSELEPSVSGPEFMRQIMNTLSRIDGSSEELKLLDQLNALLQEIDEELGNSQEEYIEISKKVDLLPTSYDLTYLFQTDLHLKPLKKELSKSVLQDLIKLMALLNRITSKAENDNLTKFREAVYNRYEDREMPLAKVLDVETGVGYIQDRGSSAINPLVDDIVLPQKKSVLNPSQHDWNLVREIIQEQLSQCDRNNDFSIHLSENDFNDLEMNWDDLPDTISGIIELISEDGKEKIKCSGFSGSSAINLISRFCHGDRALEEFATHIAQLEHKMNPEKIIAEIVHLPEARAGNILMHPRFREFEIPYLARSLQQPDQQLSIDDLMISVRYDDIVIRSKKLNKEVIPRLTNAHNFTNNSLPIYHFLCDLQTQGIRDTLGFDMGVLGYSRDFIPRVEFGNIIIGNAHWRIKIKEVEELIKVMDHPTRLKEKTDIFRQKRRIPPYAMLIDGDNELVINFKNLTSVQMLLDTVKNRSDFTLSEFLFSEEGMVNSADGYYTNQMIIAFYNSNKLKLAETDNHDQ